VVARRWRVWSGRRGSNPRHSAWKADALPTELLPPTVTLTGSALLDRSLLPDASGAADAPEPLTRTLAEAPSVAEGPTIASTRDYWALHLRSEGKSGRTILTTRTRCVSSTSSWPSRACRAPCGPSAASTATGRRPSMPPGSKRTRAKRTERKREKSKRDDCLPATSGAAKESAPLAPETCPQGGRSPHLHSKQHPLLLRKHGHLSRRTERPCGFTVPADNGSRTCVRGSVCDLAYDKPAGQQPFGGCEDAADRRVPHPAAELPPKRAVRHLRGRLHRRHIERGQSSWVKDRQSLRVPQRIPGVTNRKTTR
jgi:hypothetical protein